MRFHIIESKHHPELHAPCEGAYDVGFELKPWEDEEDTNGNDRRWRVDVATLAELVKFQRKVKSPLIIYHDDDYTPADAVATIEVYNWYRE